MTAAVGAELRDHVRRLVAARSARALTETDDRLPLGAGGLGFDSVRLVELLLDVERELAVPLDPEWLADPALSIESLAIAVARGRR
jgi:acyl carrier protein